MRLAFISTIRNFRWGGADTLWTHAAEAALARGDTVLLGVTGLVASHQRVARLITSGAQLAVRPPAEIPVSFADRVRRRLERFFPRPEPLAIALQSFRPELVIVSCAGAYDFVADRSLREWILQTVAPLRIIANFQKENPELSDADRAFIAHVFAGADAVFFVSSRNLAVTRRHLLSPLNNGTVIQNPLRWTPSSSCPWPEGEAWRLAAVGRIDHVKGVSVLLHALAGALGNDGRWHLNIYGTGGEFDYVRATAAGLGLAARVSLRGWVEDLGAIWTENHLLVSPAIDEGVPMTIPEAMLRGRPVLATCVGGAEDWIVHGETGFLCPAPTLPLLTAALREAWARRTQWPQMGQAAATAARANYRPDDFMRVIAPPSLSSIRSSP